MLTKSWMILYHLNIYAKHYTCTVVLNGKGSCGTVRDHLLPKFEHIFVAVVTFFLSFFCADMFDTSLLLIVCALK